MWDYLSSLLNSIALHFRSKCAHSFAGKLPDYSPQSWEFPPRRGLDESIFFFSSVKGKKKSTKFVYIFCTSVTRCLSCREKKCRSSAILSIVKWWLNYILQACKHIKYATVLKAFLSPPADEYDAEAHCLEPSNQSFCTLAQVVSQGHQPVHWAFPY